VRYVWMLLVVVVVGGKSCSKGKDIGGPFLLWECGWALLVVTSSFAIPPLPTPILTLLHAHLPPLQIRVSPPGSDRTRPSQGSRLLPRGGDHLPFQINHLKWHFICHLQSWANDPIMTYLNAPIPLLRI